MKKKVCVFTSTRADYGILLPLLNKLKSDKYFKLQLLVSGTHLSKTFGLTYREILKDGFKIGAKVDLCLGDDTETGICQSMAKGIVGFNRALKRFSPDFIIVLGDRFETLACAIAAHIARIPIVHISGGEVTKGAIDDAFRHAITKMSIIHFTYTDEYRQRVIQLGESPDRVFNVGALGLDNIHNLRLLNKRKLEDKLGFTFGKKTVLVAFHPVTLEKNTAGTQFKELLKALDSLKDVKVIFTGPNADIGSKSIIVLIDEYVKNYPSRCASFISLGSLKYLSAVKCVNAVVGNSSSGIVEVPSFGKPTVNIGDRQEGRIKPPSIIDCRPCQKNIEYALRKALSKEFQEFCKGVENVYGDGKTAEKIIKILKKNTKNIKDIKKNFYDERAR